MAPSTTDPSQHISFGACPKPDRVKTEQLHRTLYDYSMARSATHLASQTTLESFVPADRIKTMAEIDREYENQSRKVKAKNGIKGAVEWVEGKLNKGGKKE